MTLIRFINVFFKCLLKSYIKMSHIRFISIILTNFFSVLIHRHKSENRHRYILTNSCRNILQRIKNYIYLSQIIYIYMLALYHIIKRKSFSGNDNKIHKSKYTKKFFLYSLSLSFVRVYTSTIFPRRFYVMYIVTIVKTNSRPRISFRIGIYWQ